MMISDTFPLALVLAPDRDRIERRYTSWEIERIAPPMGLAYVAAAARNVPGVEVILLDANCPICDNGHEIHFPSIAVISEQLLARPYMVIGFSVVIDNYQPSLTIARAVKAARPETVIVFGGHHATLTWSSILADEPAVDIVVRGEGELTFAELIDRLRQGQEWGDVLGIAYRRNGSVCCTAPRPLVADLSVLPWPARDLLPPLRRYPPIQDPATGRTYIAGAIAASRGCPYHCSFCSVQTFYAQQPGQAWRSRIPTDVVDEMRSLVNDYGAEYITFCDDSLFINPKWIAVFLRAILAADLRIPFHITARADQIVRNAHLLPLLRQAGCTSVEVGIESGSQTTLDRFHKQTTVEQNLESLRLLRTYRLRPNVDLIMFDPDTTLEDLAQTLDFYRSAGMWGAIPVSRVHPAHP